MCMETMPVYEDDTIALCVEHPKDVSVITTCAKGEEGPKLHLAAGDRTPEHDYVPWVVVNGKHIESAEVRNLKQVICDAYTGPKPAACSA